MSGALWRLAGTIATATPSPSPTPGLREGLDEGAISPGLAGFLAVFAIALASLALFYSLTGKLRGVKQRGERAEAARAASDGGVPEGVSSAVVDGGTHVGDATGGDGGVEPGSGTQPDGGTRPDGGTGPDGGSPVDGEPGDPGRA